MFPPPLRTILPSAATITLAALDETSLLAAPALSDWEQVTRRAVLTAPKGVGLPEGWIALTPDQCGGDDVLVVVDRANFPLVFRALDILSQRGATVVPDHAEALVEPRLTALSPSEAAWQTTADANYVARCGLNGHYLEFGTYWGRSFFPAYHRLKFWLRDFYAFDSFAGLSAPLGDETRFSGGDFAANAYCCTEASFRAMARLAGVDEARLRVVPGYYSASIRGRSGRDFGIENRSVSVCVIDCDLYEPTRDVLDFVLPLLDDGALIYFDDWRLCRASPRVGERRAALEWLAAHPGIELVEFHRDHWQHQWFIFQRRG